MWNGRDPAQEVTYDGSNWGGIDVWSDGILTRGVLLDIPKLRGEPYVTEEKPVHAWDLEDAAKAQGTTVQPGDVVAVYSGREKWQADHPDETYGTQEVTDQMVRIRKPGLHASCLRFIRDNDISALAWDMMDAYPDGYDFPNPVPLRHICLRHRVAGQLPAAAPGGGVPGRGAVRVHAGRIPPQGPGRNRVSRQPPGRVLAAPRPFGRGAVGPFSEERERCPGPGPMGQEEWRPAVRSR